MGLEMLEGAILDEVVREEPSQKVAFKYTFKINSGQEPSKYRVDCFNKNSTQHSCPNEIDIYYSLT